jgi:hypothetical protein
MGKSRRCAAAGLTSGSVGVESTGYPDRQARRAAGQETPGRRPWLAMEGQEPDEGLTVIDGPRVRSGDTETLL